MSGASRKLFKEMMAEAARMPDFNYRSYFLRWRQKYWRMFFLNICCFIGGSPTVSRRVKSSERMKTFTSEEQIWEASVTFSISGLWLQLRSAWTCWGGRLPLANSTIQGLTLELISLHLENCLSNNLVCRVTLSHEKEKPSTWERREEGWRVKDFRED